MKNHHFCLLYQSPDGPKLQNKASHQYFFRPSISSSYVNNNYRFHCFYQNQNNIAGNVFDFLPCIGILTFRCSKECYFSCFISTLKLLILRKWRLVIFLFALCRKLQTFGNPLTNQTIDNSNQWFVLCNRILINRKLQHMFLLLIYFGVQNHL